MAYLLVRLLSDGTQDEDPKDDQEVVYCSIHIAMKDKRDLYFEGSDVN